MPSQLETDTLYDIRRDSNNRLVNAVLKEESKDCLLPKSLSFSYENERPIEIQIEPSKKRRNDKILFSYEGKRLIKIESKQKEEENHISKSSFFIFYDKTGNIAKVVSASEFEYLKEKCKFTIPTLLTLFSINPQYKAVICSSYLIDDNKIWECMESKVIEGIEPEGKIQIRVECPEVSMFKTKEENVPFMILDPNQIIEEISFSEMEGYFLHRLKRYIKPSGEFFCVDYIYDNYGKGGAYKKHISFENQNPFALSSSELMLLRKDFFPEELIIEPELTMTLEDLLK